MTRIMKHLISGFEVLLVPVSVAVTMAAAYLAFMHFQILYKMVAIVMLGVVAWPSWIGYRQNRKKNNEWPINLAICAASTLGIVGLAVSLVI